MDMETIFAVFIVASPLVAPFFQWLVLMSGFERLRKIGYRIVQVHCAIITVPVLFSLAMMATGDLSFNDGKFYVGILLLPYAFIAFPWYFDSWASWSDYEKKRNRQSESFARKVLLVYGVLFVIAWLIQLFRSSNPTFNKWT